MERKLINRLNIILLNYFILFVALFIVNSCAKEASPTGGPKDITPPEVIFETPHNYSTNFKEKRAKIYFNEYIQLKNLQEELLISPPFKEKPKIVLKGKKIIVTFQDSLPRSRTVNMNFCNAIVDLNESNPLPQYQYVFSTGQIIDTSFIDGRVVDAQTGKPIEKALVLLYENFNDSIVSQQLPSYISRTNKQGVFVINHLHSGPYKIFALVDKNRNTLFDQPTEPVAFLNDSIKPLVKWTGLIDTLQVMNVGAQGDTIYIDSLIEKQVQVSTLKPFQLKMFVYDYKKFYLNSKSRISRSLLSFGFSKSIDTLDYEINILKPKVSSETPFIKHMIAADSVLYYLTDSVLFTADSIILNISYPYTDSLNKVVTRTDSIVLTYNQKQLTKADTLLTFSTNLRTKKLDIDSILQINWSEPLKEIDQTKIYFQVKRDTIFEPLDFLLDTDKLFLNTHISFKQDLLATYRLIFDSAAFVGSTGKILDSTAITFNYFENADYGNLVVTLDTITNDAIYQLVDKKNKVISEIKYPISTKVQFNQLIPGTYSLRVLIDRNRNGKWDTGNYYKKLQPEVTIAMPGEVVIKGNWDTEQNWDISSELKLLD